MPLSNWVDNLLWGVTNRAQKNIEATTDFEP